jgi:hypothetical protein
LQGELMERRAAHTGRPRRPLRPIGHAHFWQRALSRRQLLKATAGTAVAAATSGLWLPALAHAARPGSSEPRPIPGGIQPFGPGTEIFHLFLPGPNDEPSVITDFNGFVGVALIRGTGTRTHPDGHTTPQLFEVDMRFMEGVYVGLDGQHRRGTFAFI